MDPARCAEVLAAYAQNEGEVRGEAGTRVWEVCTEADDENVVWLFVRSGDAAAAAHELHRSSDAARQLGSILMAAIDGAPEFHDLVPRFSKHR